MMDRDVNQSSWIIHLEGHSLLQPGLHAEAECLHRERPRALETKQGEQQEKKTIVQLQEMDWLTLIEHI